MPATDAKIRICYAPGVNPEFSTASELRDCLLASYPEGAAAGRPIVRVNRDDSAPAWGWVVDLIQMRTDWWPALGIALQHAATDGGDLARTALADLAAEFRDSMVLLPWTSPAAGAWPDVCAESSGTGWGLPDLRLESIIRDQTKYLAEVKSDTSEVFLSGYGKRGYGKGGKAITAPFTTEAELRSVLDITARAGQFPDGDKGPWSWLGFELLIGGAWLRPAWLQVVATIDAAAEPHMLYALLDWLSEERYLWQFYQLLDGWNSRRPSWWMTPADTKPTGWERTIRSSHWPDVSTLGDVAVEALRRALDQVATSPVIDLPALFGQPIANGL